MQWRMTHSRESVSQNPRPPSHSVTGCRAVLRSFAPVAHSWMCVFKCIRDAFSCVHVFSSFPSPDVERCATFWEWGASKTSFPNTHAHSFPYQIQQNNKPVKSEIFSHTAPCSVKVSNYARGHIHAPPPTAFPSDPIIRGMAASLGRWDGWENAKTWDEWGDRAIGAGRRMSLRLRWLIMVCLLSKFCHFRLWQKVHRL